MGRREWARGTFNADCATPRTAAGSSRPSRSSPRLDGRRGRSLLRVSAPAGVARRVPPYGSPGNAGFVWHGAAAADFDRDGWLDLFVTSKDQNLLYLNDGAGRFRDASRETLAGSVATGTAPLVLDYDNDGDADVFISSVGPQVLLENPSPRRQARLVVRRCRRRRRPGRRLLAGGDGPRTAPDIKSPLQPLRRVSPNPVPLHQRHAHLPSSTRATPRQRGGCPGAWTTAAVLFRRVRGHRRGRLLTSAPRLRRRHVLNRGDASR